MFPFILFALLIADFYLIFVFAPEEAHQGLAQKIFYFHVSSAFAMYLSFITAGIAALLYLWKRKPSFDSYSYAGVWTGLLFLSMVLISGPIWAKPIWGTWWTWDPRLTTTLLLMLIFVAYILLRRFFGSDERGALLGAIVTLFGVLDIPLIFFSVKLWRGIHPSVLGGESNMPWEMKLALIFTNIVVLILAGYIFWMRARVHQLERRLTA